MMLTSQAPANPSDAISRQVIVFKQHKMVPVEFGRAMQPPNGLPPNGLEDALVLLAEERGYSAVLARDGIYGFELLRKPYSIDALAGVFGKVRRAASSESVR
jgi:hypothetical protein